MGYSVKQNKISKAYAKAGGKPSYMLYIFRNGDTNQYKIGITKDLNKRYTAVQTGCPGELQIVKLYSAPIMLEAETYEKALHKYFKNKKTRKGMQGGEWFTLTKEDIQLLCEPSTLEEQRTLIGALALEAYKGGGANEV